MIAFPFPTVEGLLSELDKIDLRVLALTCEGADGDYVEIGSNRGLSSLCIASGMPATKRLHCYDFFEPDKLPRFLANVQDAGFQDQIGWFRGNFRDTTPKNFPPSIAFAFVDHDHTLSSTADAYALIWPRLSVGGIVAFHDYQHPDYAEPTPFLEGLPGERVIARGGLLALRK